MDTRPSKSSSNNPLISRERSQKLDLLNHLIANLTQTIVVCGPKGIGKSRLLRVFQDSKTQSSMVCYVIADSNLTLEKIENAIGDTFAETLPDLKSQSITVALDRINSRGAKIVLVVDDAGLLVPGLIEKIIAYVNSKPALRVVLALTHCELYLKNITDPIIDDCYLVEIPPLSPPQCEDYLEYLSTMPTPRIEFNRINEDKVAELFRETHGIPGKILELLPKPDNQKPTDYSKPALISAVVGLVLIALGVQWWSNNKSVVDRAAVPKQNQTASSNNSPLADQRSVDGQNKAPIAGPLNDINKILPNKIIEAKNTAAQSSEQKPELTTPVAQIASKSADNSVVQTLPLPVQETSQSNTEAGINLGKGDHWLMAQPGVNYTLQLMALSKEQDMLEVLQRHPELGDELRYLKTKTQRGNDRFVLFYGSFTNPEQIKSEKQKLPKEFQKIWVRKIADFQKEIEMKEQTLSPTPAE